MGWTQDWHQTRRSGQHYSQSAKNGSPVGYLLKLVFRDGRELGTQEQR